MTAAGAAGAAAAALPRRGPAPRGRDAPAPAALLAAYMAAAALLFAATTLHGCGGGTPSAGDEAKERQDEGAAEKGPLELEQAGQYDPKHCQTLLQGQLEKYKEDLQKRCPVYLAALDDKFTVDYAAYPMCLELNKIAYHRAEVDLEKYRSNNDVSEEQAMKDKDGAVTAVFYRLERKIRRRLGEIVEGGRRLQQDVRTFVTLVLEIDKNVSSEQLVTEIDEFFDFEKNWAFFSNAKAAELIFPSRTGTALSSRSPGHVREANDACSPVRQGEGFAGDGGVQKKYAGIQGEQFLVQAEPDQ